MLINIFCWSLSINILSLHQILIYQQLKRFVFCRIALDEKMKKSEMRIQKETKVKQISSDCKTDY